MNDQQLDNAYDDGYRYGAADERKRIVAEIKRRAGIDGPGTTASVDYEDGWNAAAEWAVRVVIGEAQ